MVLAMAQWQSTRPEEARNAPAKGLEIIDTKLPKPESGDMSMGSPKVPAVPASVLNQSSETGISSRQPISDFGPAFLRCRQEITFTR